MGKLDTSVGSLLKELDRGDALDFKPNEAMKRAKVRFWENVRENSLNKDISRYPLTMMATLAGTRRFEEWAEKPMFLAWFCDEKFESHKVQTLADRAIAVLADILEAPEVEKLLTAKDKINAAKLLLDVADRFPSKSTKIVYVDKGLEKLNDKQVELEMEKIARQLDTAKDEG